MCERRRALLQMGSLRKLFIVVVCVLAGLALLIATIGAVLDLYRPCAVD